MLFNCSNFVKDYQDGLTPNPDILCNRKIKFHMFYKHVIESQKFDCFATGHYARTSFGPFLEQFEPKTDARLLKAADTFKDQTFFLSQVPQEALRLCMFPVGVLNKHEVKRIADDVGLRRIAGKKESIGICFIGDRTFQSFINDYIDIRPGSFVDIETGQVVGSHQGIHNWTVGQGCKISGSPQKRFVLRKDPATSTIFVASGTDHPLLWSDIFYTKEPVWIRKSPFESNKIFNCQFRFQHTKPLTNCTICKANEAGDRFLVKLERPLRSITPGQFAVFYKNGECLGSSRIVDACSLINASVTSQKSRENLEKARVLEDESEKASRRTEKISRKSAQRT